MSLSHVKSVSFGILAAELISLLLYHEKNVEKKHVKIGIV